MHSRHLNCSLACLISIACVVASQSLGQAPPSLTPEQLKRLQERDRIAGEIQPLLRAGKLALRAGPRPLSGPAFLFGYLRAAAGGTRRVEDPAFRAFMRADQRRRTARVLTRGRR